jgi:hypothetical protein
MLNKINKFLHTLYNFAFCLCMIWQGFNVNTNSNRPISYKELWRYCKEWEEGKL